MELNEWHQLQQRVGTVENIVEARTRAGLPILPNQGQDQPSRNGPMVRKTRKSAQAEAAAAAAAASSSKQPEQQVEDEEMVDAPSPPPPALADEDEPIDEPVSPVDDSDAPSARSTPARGQWSSAQKRRAGRPSKARAHDWDEADEAELPDAADTPKKRGGWRGRSVRGGRGGRTRGGPSHVTQVPMDKDGNILTVKDDEIQLPEDPEGETKIDQMGNLQGNRQYRVRVFTISGKGDRLYMLSTEPARCVNYRDSYLLFQKHPQLYKIILSEEAKRDLIARNIIPHSYKGRAIGVVTAHSIFREFGARVVVGGRKIVDDYQVAAARARGDVEGAIADVDDKLPTGNAAYDVNQYVAWHGASNVYHSGQPSAPRPNGKNADGKKRKAITNREEWMLVHAREASAYNSKLTQQRRQNNKGVYNIHTNVVEYPSIMQPTHVRWEQLPVMSTSSETVIRREPLEGDSSASDLPSANPQQDTANPAGNQTIFPDVEPSLSRNYMVADIVYVSPPVDNPPICTLDFPDQNGGFYEGGPGGLANIPDHIVDLLPPDCRREFDKAKANQLRYMAQWSSEATDGARASPRITYNGYSSNAP